MTTVTLSDAARLAISASLGSSSSKFSNADLERLYWLGGTRRQKMSNALDALRSISQCKIGVSSSYKVKASDTPTIVHGAAATIVTNPVEFTPTQTEYVTAIGTGIVNDGTFGFYDSTENGFDGGRVKYGFMLTGTEFEVRWRAAAGFETLHVFVDDEPLYATPNTPSGITVSGGNQYWTKYTFTGSSTRKIMVYPQQGQVMRIRFNSATTSICPLPSNPKLFFCGDSFLGGSALIPAQQSWGYRIGFATGSDFCVQGQGGTGYVAPGSFGARAFTDASRLDPIIEFSPDLCIVYLGGNDRLNDPVAVKAAAVASYAYLDSKAPNVPILVVGTYPSNSVDTVSAQLAAVNKSIRDAALAAPNVIGFIDPIGNSDIGTVPVTFTNGLVLSVGTKVVYQGSIWVCSRAHTAGATPDPMNMSPLTWLTGTGTVAAPANNGNRDVLLSGDGVHWTLDGAGITAARIIEGSIQILNQILAA